jgi:CRP/FNR family transcriptional regulator, cyclic AMP receptor protein
MGVADILERTPPFAGLDREQLDRLATFATEADVRAGTELTHEGRYEGYVFVVVSGSVGIERDGRQVDTIGAGGFFGEIAAIDGGPRTATARALEDSRLVTISHESFNDVVETTPEFRAAVSREMDRRLARMDAEGRR